MVFLIWGCEAKLEHICPNVDFYIGEMTDEQHNDIRAQTNKNVSNELGACLEEGDKGRLSECPPRHDTLTAKPNKMPAVSSGTLLPDIVVEFNQRGELANYWTTPAEPRLYAVEGDAIYIRQDNFAEDAWQYFKIRTNREYNIVRKPISRYRKPIKCPSDVSMFSKPTHVECWEFIDLATGDERIFAIDKPAHCRRIGPNANRSYFENPKRAII